MQIVRRRRTITTGKVTLERVYGVTSLRPHRATPADLASWVRGHWGIKNKVHHVRDTAFGEAPPVCVPATHPGPWPACAT
ncbi:hypothetical protein AB0D33_17670 [Streptomyces sp. NPDC048404]|uniref:hypothetical protein n=1 Tax=unclassified Streptomyces TaxID=2593676 RepID=UPI00341386CC